MDLNSFKIPKMVNNIMIHLILMEVFIYFYANFCILKGYINNFYLSLN